MAGEQVAYSDENIERAAFAAFASSFIGDARAAWDADSTHRTIKMTEVRAAVAALRGQGRNLHEAARSLATMPQDQIMAFAQHDPDLFRDVAAYALRAQAPDHAG